tara:strand:+ start:7821 stop:8069 length:249 start_codon:yes stop_codon:yes gene_type:complete
MSRPVGIAITIGVTVPIGITESKGIAESIKGSVKTISPRTVKVSKALAIIATPKRIVKRIKESPVAIKISPGVIVDIINFCP